MDASRDSAGCSNLFVSTLESSVRERAPSKGAPSISRAPGVVDVMGGIGEDAGSLVLTGSSGLCFTVGIWPIATSELACRIIGDGFGGDGADFTIPSAALKDAPAALIQRCKAGGEWAAATLLGIQRAIRDAGAAAPTAGLAILIEQTFPSHADLGRVAAQVTASVDAYCRMSGVQCDQLKLAQAGANAVEDLIELRQLRKTMTCLSAPNNGSLLQMRFHPNLFRDPLELPQGVVIRTVTTRLSRPTSNQRLIETRLYSDMGHRVIMDLQRSDGIAVDPAHSRLASITPAEFVERYRDRMPSKMTHQQFVTRFGSVRGLPGDGANPKEIYKIRSRAEHHIYENRRVHDFATQINRSRRTGSLDGLITAGELMYASHWSHSQRCGIGGVETDRLVTSIRKLGPTSGLFGAKVTTGGEGGELVVLMRNDPASHSALNQAIDEARQASKTPVYVFDGALPGAQFFSAPPLAAAGAA